MNVGSQSTLNDLKLIKALQDALEAQLEQIEISKLSAETIYLFGLESDLNKANESGFYFVDRKNEPTMINHPPAANTAVMLSVAGNGGRIAQTAYDYGTNRVFGRRKQDDIWKDWFQYLTTGNTIVDADGFIKTV